MLAEELSWCGMKNKFPGDLKIWAQALLTGASVNDLRNSCKSKANIWSLQAFHNSFGSICFQKPCWRHL